MHDYRKGHHSFWLQVLQLFSAATMPGYARQTDQSQVRRTKESPKKENNWFEAKSGSGLVYCEDYFIREDEVGSDNESLNSLPRVIDSVST